MFIIKYCGEFNLIFFVTAKSDYVIRTRVMFSFLPLMNNSVTIGLSTINIGLGIKYDQYFLFFIWIVSFEYLIKVSELLKYFMSAP